MTVAFVVVCSVLSACAVAYEPEGVDVPGRVGAVDADAIDDTPCLVISEYLEGLGAHNKAVEVFNCGVEPIELAEMALCTVHNDATSCGPTVGLGDRVLEVGQVLVLCNSREGPPDDPLDAIRDHCDIEAPEVVFFNGDDRLVLFRDGDHSTSYTDCNDTIIDVLGIPSERPRDMPWADVTLRRCELTPTPGAPGYDYRDYFADYPLHEARDLGSAPTPDCI